MPSVFISILVLLLLFLKNKSTIIPFITVPISILSTFIFLNFFGYSINLITLLALVLCTGLVIDDSIVMLENIYKKIENGIEKKAAIEGSKEVFFAIISTSIVLISIFIPVVFLKGDTAKQLFEELAITIIGAIFFSTIVSL